MSHDTCKVVRIVSTDPKSQGDFVEINETDFNDKIHTLYKGKTPSAPPPPAAAVKGGKKAPPPPAAAVVVEAVIADDAKALADDAGFDYKDVVGTGEKGLIVLKDIEAAIESLTAPKDGE